MTINSNNNFKSACKQGKGVCYGHTWSHDQIASRFGKTSHENCEKSTYAILGQTVSPRFYPGTAIRHSDTTAVFPDRLPRHSAVTRRPYRPEKSVRSNKSSTLHHASESPAKACKKRAWHNLLTAIFADARAYKLINESSEASIDSTGLESRFVSRHFLMRQGKRTQRYRKWTKLTVVCDNASHLIAGAVVSVGPSNDCPYLPEAVGQAVENLAIDRLLADAGYDAEANHKLCREELGIRSTVIPVNDRHRKTGQTTGRYRREMKKSFPKRNYRQRWQVESVVSRMKRRLGNALRARDEQARAAESLFRVLTYNLMILYLLFKMSFSNVKTIFLN